MIESTYSCSSLVGFVSSNRRLNLPPYSCASPKFRQMLFACPMCKYPFGSGGNRVCTRPPFFPAARSASMICSMKLRDDFSAPDSILPRKFVTAAMKISHAHGVHLCIKTDRNIIEKVRVVYQIQALRVRQLGLANELDCVLDPSAFRLMAIR